MRGAVDTPRVGTGMVTLSTLGASSCDPATEAGVGLNPVC